ncbi:MAG: hypothetical protein H0W64_02500 [Gammaproteobacteria bacterium]|nr:hypothetical protein [Gammaproteobacteria bacterium]
MNLLTGGTTIGLWHHVIKQAEDQCSVTLKQELEAYLVSLLARYIDKPEMAKQIFATAFLEAINQRDRMRHISLQNVGDGCLLFAGLFPQAAERRQAKVSYFVDVGRSAYANISHASDDIYNMLAMDFVVLMDVLQSIQNPDLMPLEAYEQWNDVGSQRAFKMLKAYTRAIPFRHLKR